eukprot:4328954-Pyramimonas_sp.AAC.2
MHPNTKPLSAHRSGSRLLKVARRGYTISLPNPGSVNPPVERSSPRESPMDHIRIRSTNT